MDINLDNFEIGNRIRSLREDMCMSREKFSEMIDISEVFLGQIERGESSLSIKTLLSIVAFTGSSTDFILLGDNSQNSYTQKINRMLKYASSNTLDLIYNLIHDIHTFSKKETKQTKSK